MSPHPPDDFARALSTPIVADLVAAPISRRVDHPHIVAIEPLALLRSGFEHMLRLLIPEATVSAFESVETLGLVAAQFALLGIEPQRYCEEERLDATMRALQRQCGGAPIGAALHSADLAMARRLMALGAAGVLLPSLGVDIAAAAIRLMMVGGTYLPPEMAGIADLTFASSVARDKSALPATRPLTARERQILKGLRAGGQNKNIAFELGISESTVKVHLRNMMRKLRAANRTQIAVNGVDIE